MMSDGSCQHMLIGPGGRDDVESMDVRWQGFSD